METIPCPHCAAPIKPSATFCLACDSPLVPVDGRLSVAEPVQVDTGRPVVALVAAATVLLLLAGAVYGVMGIVRHQHAAARAAVVDDITRGTTLLVEAESGDLAACHGAGAVLASTSHALHQDCTGIVDHDPGVKVDRISVDRLDLLTSTGTARVRMTVTDSKGTRTVDRVVALVHRAQGWRLTWNGAVTV